MSVVATEQPPNAVVNEQGDRWYVHPVTGERFRSVTTVLSNVAGFGLLDWAAKLTAHAAFERLPWLTRVADQAACNVTKTDDACGECPDCVRSWLANRHNEVRDEAADLGSRLHAAAEAEVLFGPGATVDADVQPYYQQWRRWRDAWQPEFFASEMTVVSRKWGYAGTLDFGATCRDAGLLPPKFKHLAGLPVLGDYFTGKTAAIRKAIQAVAYSRADVVLLPDGEELPLPRFDSGLLVHIRPDKVQVREIPLAESTFAVFLHILRMADGLDAGLNTFMSRPYTLGASK